MDERSEQSLGERMTMQPGGASEERRRLAEKERERAEEAKRAAAREAEWAAQRAREAVGEEVSEGERVTQGAGWKTAEEWGGRRWKAGEEILGRYVVEGELGQGGMGVVYACLDKVGRVRTAVKALPPELSHNRVEMEEVRENFELVYTLSHPNIAGVRTLERDGKGEYYLVMELAEGESLRRWMRRKRKEGEIPLEEAVRILRQVAAALDYAHGERVVHRDVKPGNVSIDGRGRVKVLDFGLAAQIRTSLSRASRAYRGTSGTGPYMAPEQWEAQPQDAKTDQYALAVMAYEMLAGRLPFENSELSVLKSAVLKGMVREIPGLPKRAMAALRRGMAKRAEERFGSCGEFVEALAGGGGRRNVPTKLLVGGLAALAVLAGLGVGVWKWSGKSAGETSALPAETGLETVPPPRAAFLEGVPPEADGGADETGKAGLAERETEEAARAAEAARQAEQKAAADALQRRRNDIDRLATRARDQVQAPRSTALDLGQTFKEKTDEMNLVFQRAEIARANGDFDAAQAGYDAAMAAAEWLKEREQAGEEAVRSRADAEKARSEAQNAGAGRLAASESGTGDWLMAEAEKAFGTARFEGAQRQWKAAAAAFRDAAQKARSSAIDTEISEVRLAMDESRWNDATVHLDRLLDIDSGNQEAFQLREAIGQRREREAKVKELLEQGKAALHRRDFDEAGALARQVLNLEPDNQTAKELGGNAAFWKRQFPVYLHGNAASGENAE